MSRRKPKPLPMEGSYFVMSRRGTFTPVGRQDEQCVEPGWSSYDYFVKLVCDGHMLLDERTFIVDHKEVDNLIQGTVFRGSCEVMVKHLTTKLHQFFIEKKIPILAIKVRITGANRANPPAWLEFAWTKDDVLLPLLGDTYDGR